MLLTVVLAIIKSIDVVAQVALALVLGIWALRQVVVPSGAPGYTAIDLLMLILYAFIGIITVKALGFHIFELATADNRDKKWRLPKLRQQTIDDKGSSVPPPVIPTPVRHKEITGNTPPSSAQTREGTTTKRPRKSRP